MFKQKIKKGKYKNLYFILDRINANKKMITTNSIKI